MRKALQCPGGSSSRVDQDLDVEASLVAVLLAVVDVLAKHPALDAQLGVHGQVNELQRHQGLLVVRVQQLAVVGVVLQWEAAADAVVLDLADFAGVLFFLEGHGNVGWVAPTTTKKGGDEGVVLAAGYWLLFTYYCGQRRKRKNTGRAYLVGAVDWDDVRLHLGLGLLWNAFV